MPEAKKSIIENLLEDKAESFYNLRNKYEEFYTELRNLYGFGNSITENSLIFKAIKDINPEEELSIVQEIIDNYQILLEYKRIMEKELGDELELTPALLYEFYQDLIIENAPKIDKRKVNWKASIDPNLIREKFPNPHINMTNSDYDKHCIKKARSNKLKGKLEF